MSNDKEVKDFFEATGSRQLGSNEVLCLPCLGRPFRLGMLYDFCQDTIIPGLTFWNPETLAKATEEKKDADPDQTSYSFEVLTEDRLSDKMFHLDAGPNLELSVLGGLVSVSGAAEFVKDRKQTKNTARVTLRYKCTSRFESLSMEHLAKLDHKNSFDYTNATHVVTGLLYGAEMYFVFERRVESGENFFKIHANMEALIKKFPKVAIGFESKGEIEVEKDDREFLKKLQCKVYGDILLEKNPTTGKESTEIYKNIPQVLKEKNMRNTIPKKVWLYPLCNLAKQHGVKEKPPPIVREIHSTFVEQSERFLEDIHDIILRTNEIQDKIICKSCKTFNSQLVRFKTMVMHYKQRFQKQIAEYALKVRAGDLDEKIPDILEQVFSSKFLFSPVLLDQWLDMKEKEIVIMEETVKFFKNDWKETEELKDSDGLKFALQPGKLEKIVHSFKFDRVVSFEFIINQKNAFLSAMEKYLQKEEVPKSSVTMSWCMDTKNLRKCAKLFKRLMVEKTQKSRAVPVGRLVQDSPIAQQEFLIRSEANDIAVRQKETSCDKQINLILKTWKWKQSTTFVFAVRNTKDALEAEVAVVAKYINATRFVVPFPKIAN